MARKEKKNYTLLPQGELEPLNGRKPEDDDKWSPRWWYFPCVVALIFLVAFTITVEKKNHNKNDVQLPPSDQKACPQFPALEALSAERKNFEAEMTEELTSDGFFKASTKRMQGAIQIATESFDDMGPVGEDKRWEVFIGLQEYLKKTFPLV